MARADPMQRRHSGHSVVRALSDCAMSDCIARWSHASSAPSCSKRPVNRQVLTMDPASALDGPRAMPAGRVLGMRIGISGGGATVDRAVVQATEAEAAGFTSLWYPGSMFGDPLVGMALAGRATSSIEIGVAVLQTYACHPVLQATRLVSVSTAIGRGITVGIGPSHDVAIERMGLSYANAGRHTEEYMRVLAPLLRGQDVDFEGEDFRVHAAGMATPAPVSVLLGALGPRLLRVAGEIADGTILWMTNARAIETHVVPRIRAAAESAGRPDPRVVAGLPVAVHDDVDEARAAAAEQFVRYANLPNYKQSLARGGIASPAEAVIVGNEGAVTQQIARVFEAGATDVWAPPFPVGADRERSRTRTRNLLRHLAQASVFGEDARPSRRVRTSPSEV